MKRKLILFTRYPEAGRAKTRLIPALGRQGAAALQREMTKQTLTIAEKTALNIPVDLEINYEGGSNKQMALWLGLHRKYCEQGPGSLGEKMSRSFESAFDTGFDRVIIIGADCPALTPDILATGFSGLNGHDLVLGPARDGGYYLIGLSGYYPELFTNKSWGAGSLLAETITTARKRNLKYLLLKELADVDRPEDLKTISGHSDPE